MNRIINYLLFCCCCLIGILTTTPAFSQCTPDPACTEAQLICPGVLPNGCVGDAYSQSITVTLGDSIAGFPLTDITLDSITGLPPGFTFSCTPSDCIFLPSTSSCVLISGTGAPAGTYTLRGFLQVDIGIFTVPIDTPLGLIVIDSLDCNGDCGGTATIDGCGICSGGNTGLLPNCDDGDPCTFDDCDTTSGGCLNILNTCDDGDPCTDDLCVSGGCQNTLINCNDGDPCTDDGCFSGTCVNSPVTCDDADPCTTDSCLAGLCINTPTVTNTSHTVTATGMTFIPDSLVIQTGDTVVWNAIDGFHNINGSLDSFPTNPEGFLSGAPQAAPFTYSFVFDTPGSYDYQCDVHFTMGMVGHIQVNDPPVDCAGVCNGTASLDNCGICSGGTTGILPNCDDANACTTDTCDGLGGCINTVLVCDDSNACTTDLCDSLLGCTFTAIVCNDSTACTTDSCVGGTCQFTAVLCDDLDSCTVDACDSLLGCTFTAIPGCGTDPCDTLVCDDADLCTTDTCAAGACVFTAVVCNDSTACTTDSCVNGVCQFSAIVCDDLDSCTVDACDSLLGCTFTAIPGCGTDPCDTLVCDDANLCTTDTCAAGACVFTPVVCNDSTACTTDSCVAGVCQFTAIICDDSDLCTTDACDSTLGCTFTAIVCDDSTACTTDSCVAGICQFTTIVCDDGDTCTVDACDSLLGCTFTAIPGCATDPCDTLVCDDANSCTIDTCTLGACVFTAIVCDDQDSCTLDSCVNGLCVFTPNTCDDGDSCTIDACLGGICSNTPISCDDQDLCTLDSCAAGVCINTPLNCDDLDSCTVDGCVAGLCVNTPIVCDDSSLCTTDACVGGTCVFTPVVCDDSDSCTVDGCVNGACEFTPIICNDSVACTNDVCVAGVCQFVPVVCNDSNACTLDSCVAGICQFTPVVCSDNDSCTVDACVAGICQFTPVNCDDLDSCTVDLCQGGNCVNIPVNCSDGDPCTNDLCNAGICSNPPIDCSDGDGCTDDLCVNGSCFNNPVNCDDANQCTNDFCDTTGTCQNTQIAGCCLTAADCDDANLCTDDICNGGICLLIPTCCDDGSLCTIDVCDTADGQCDFVALFCDDNDACTTNSCDTGVCVFTPINCDDADLCTADSCANGICLHTPQNCDDGDPCTTDFCDSLGVCQNQAILCDDADLCTNDSCIQGICVFTPVLCDDSDLCTVDKCVVGSCVFTAVDCGDFNPCTQDVCIGGNCFNNPIAGCCLDSSECDDAQACTQDLCVNNACVNNNTNTDLDITQTTLPLFCQGSGLVLNAVTTTPSTYAWSTGESTASIQVATSGTYTVTATDSAGCPAIDSITVTVDASALLSSYVIVARKEVDLSQNTVASGGVGVTQNGGKLKLKNLSVITAAGTFAKADNIQLSGGSTVTTQVNSEATLALPVFEANLQCNQGQDVVVGPNQNVTLNGSLYNGITVGVNSTVTFTSGDINLENIFTKSNVTINFTAPCVKLRICKKLQLGGNNSFNTTNSADVVAYVVQDVTVAAGTSFVGDIYMTGGKFTVLSASNADPNSFTGLYIVNMLQAGSNTIWNQNPACDPNCASNQPPVQCNGNDRRVVSFSLVNATTDQDLGTLSDGDIIDICQTPINIRANVCDDANIESVRFLLNGNNYRMENLPFYTIAGDNNGNYLPWNITPGTYTIRAIPFSGNNGTGTTGTDHSVTVTFVCNAPRLANPNQTMGTDMLERGTMLKGYPNLFSDKLNIEFSLPTTGKVTLDIIDIAGNKIAELFNGVAEGEKTYKTEFRAGDAKGGMIIYRLQTENGVYYNKAVIVR